MMKSNLHTPMEIILRQMDLWYRTSLGGQVFAAEREELAKYLPHYFGDYLVQLGGPSELSLFDSSPIRHCTRVSPEPMPVFHGPSVQADFYDLPFLPNSVNLVLLPHVLEFVTKPQTLLQQIYPIIAPEGRLIVLTMNPYSLWGMIKYFSHRKTLLWRGRFRSITQLRQWLLAQGFVIEQVSSVFFRPPLKSKKLLHRSLILEAMGRLFWPLSGAVSVVIAKKQVVPLLPLQEPTKKRQPVMELEPTLRVG